MVERRRQQIPGSVVDGFYTRWIVTVISPSALVNAKKTE